MCRSYLFSYLNDASNKTLLLNTAYKLIEYSKTMMLYK